MTILNTKTWFSFFISARKFLNPETGSATVTGWGHEGKRSHDSQADVVLSDALKEIEIQIHTDVACKSVMDGFINENPVDIESQFCAGGGERDACRGDSGGPLVVKNPNRDAYTQVGIVSYGYGCGLSEKFGIYTRLPKLISWVQGYILPWEWRPRSSPSASQMSYFLTYWGILSRRSTQRPQSKKETFFFLSIQLDAFTNNLVVKMIINEF